MKTVQEILVPVRTVLLRLPSPMTQLHTQKLHRHWHAAAQASPSLHQRLLDQHSMRLTLLIQH